MSFRNINNAFIVAVGTLCFLLGTTSGQSCQSAYEVICNAENLGGFCNLIIEVGLQDTLNDNGSDLTVFAPIDAAVQELRTMVGSDNMDALRDIALYHIHESGAVYMTDVQCVAPQNLMRMATDRDSRTICVDNVPTFQKGGGNSDTAKPVLIDVDKPACNGVVHTIDRALLPHGAGDYESLSDAGADSSSSFMVVKGTSAISITSLALAFMTFLSM